MPEPRKRTCACHCLDAADCMESRCGRSYIDGERERCECDCHDDDQDALDDDRWDWGDE